jgi:hypothetical protein
LLPSPWTRRKTPRKPSTNAASPSRWATGCFYEERRQILHSTGYVLRPDGTVAVGVYSTGPIGRLVWQDVLALVQFYKKRG